MLPRALSLKRRLHHCNACRPMVLTLGAAPSTCRFSTGYPPRYRPVLAGLKARCFTLKACRPLASVTSAAPAIFGLRGRRVCCSSSRTKDGTPGRTRTGLHLFEKQSARLLSVQGRIKKWLLAWTRTKTEPLNRRRDYFIRPSNEMVGHPGNAPGSLLVPSEAGCLSPSCPMKSGGTLRSCSPNPS